MTVEKRVGVAYLWWFPWGIFGAHHFYLGRPGRAVLYMLTGGLFLIGWLVDGLTLSTQVRRVNARGY